MVSVRRCAWRWRLRIQTFTFYHLWHVCIVSCGIHGSFSSECLPKPNVWHGLLVSKQRQSWQKHRQTPSQKSAMVFRALCVDVPIEFMCAASINWCLMQQRIHKEIHIVAATFVLYCAINVHSAHKHMCSGIVQPNVQIHTFFWFLVFRQAWMWIYNYEFFSYADSIMNTRIIRAAVGRNLCAIAHRMSQQTTLHFLAFETTAPFGSFRIDHKNFRCCIFLSARNEPEIR